MRFFEEFAAIRRQIAVVSAIADYDMDRKSTQSSLGNWQGVIEPMNMMLFFIAMRVGFSFLRGRTDLQQVAQRICTLTSLFLLFLDFLSLSCLETWR